MLTRDAQPKSPAARRARRSLSAAGGVFAAIALILSPLALPDGSAAAASGSGAWPWPLLGEVITPYRNGSDPYAAGQHRGLDIAAPVGSPVLAIVDGRVSFSGRLPDGGLTVTVASSDGEWLVSDLHLSERAVARGDVVHAGEKLGAVGTTGRRSAEQPHLHLSVRRATSRAYVDPMSLLGPQVLPSAPKSAPAAAQTQPAAQSVSTAPLEHGARGTTSVHAQATGDSAPASRHGALAGSKPTRSSAGAHAREGHAAEKATSRVAPPPLEVAPAIAAEPSVSARRMSAPSVAQSTNGGAGLPRWLLVAIAAVCGGTLLMRRRPGGTSGPVRGDPGEALAGREAEVVRLSERRRSA